MTSKGKYASDIGMPPKRWMLRMRISFSVSVSNLLLTLALPFSSKWPVKIKFHSSGQSIFIPGIILCTGIVICNLSVRKVLYRSHHKMRRQFRSIQPIPMLNRSTVRSPQKSASFHDSSIFRMIGEPTTEEIRFAKLMTFLSISFLACWLPQMVSFKSWIILPNKETSSPLLMCNTYRRWQ